MTETAKHTRATVISSLRYRDAAAAIEWLCEVAGFTKHSVYPGPEGTIEHSELAFGNGMIMVSSIRDSERMRAMAAADFPVVIRKDTSGISVRMTRGILPRGEQVVVKAMTFRASIFGTCMALLACAEALTLPRLAIPAGPFVPGQSYFGRNNYIEYVAGNAPVILTAPHGGALTPAEIPDRTAGSCGGSATTTTDLNTAQLVAAMQQRYFARFGKYPHVIINHLARKKLDANRTILEAACGDPEAVTAFNEWHDFINSAKGAVLQSTGKGWYMDMHGHGHSIQRLELGYLLTGSQLDLADASLDANTAYQDTASMRTVSEVDPISFSVLLRGSTSLGSLYAANGFPSIPSSSSPRPNGDPYFTGGGNTRRHTCGAEAAALGGETGGNICGVQIEANYTGVRDNAANRDKFGDATAVVLEQYLSTHWGIPLAPPPPPPTFTLATRGYKQNGVKRADLTWSGAASSSIDVYRNGARLLTTPNDGAHTDVGKVSGTYTYKVCNVGATTCSNNSSVTF